jgi:hypothetical protein
MNLENDDHSHTLRVPAHEDSRQRVRRYKASRIIDFVSRCPEFDELAASDICSTLELDFVGAVEFLAQQRGFDSLEAAYHHFAFEPDNGDEDYQTASLNIEVERLRISAVAGGLEVYDAILRHLRSFKTQAIDEEGDQNDDRNEHNRAIGEA